MKNDINDILKSIDIHDEDFIKLIDNLNDRLTQPYFSRSQHSSNVIESELGNISPKEIEEDINTVIQILREIIE